MSDLRHAVLQEMLQVAPQNQDGIAPNAATVPALRSGLCGSKGPVRSTCRAGLWATPAAPAARYG
jgi:hypothetical protein